YAYAGAANSLGDAAGDLLEHLRTNVDGGSGFSGFSYDQMFADNLVLNSSGIAGSPSQFFQVALGAGGNFLVGIGGGSDYYLTLAVRTLPMNGSGVFINPSAIVNSTTNTPFTAQISGGEDITIYGTGIGPSTAQSASAPFPNSLGGVSVTIKTSSGSVLPAPVYYV